MYWNTIIARFVRKHDIAIFYIFSLLLGTGITYLVVKRILPSGLILLAATSASLSAIIVTAIVGGKMELKKLLSRLLIWRADTGYWCFALFILPPTVLLGFYLNPIFGGESMDLSNIKPLYTIIPMLIIFTITAGLGEELGWTGFLTPRLQAKHNALTSSIIRGIMWGLWHLPLFIFSGIDHPSLADFPYSGWVAQKGFLIAMIAFIVFNQIPWSIFYTWIFNNTKGSLLLVSVLHGSEVWFAYWLLSTGINGSNFDNYWGVGLVMILVAIIIVFTNGAKNLSRKHIRVMR